MLRHGSSRFRRQLQGFGAGLLMFVSVALLVWQLGTGIPAWALLGAPPFALGLAIWRYVVAPPAQRDSARRLVMLVLGTWLFAISVWTERNVQVEGLFFGLLTGVVEGAVIHYLIAKIVGPLLFGRIWCGWACWIGALLDLLPFRRAPGRRPPWTRLRFLHFALSLALVCALWFGTGYGLGAIGPAAVRWFMAGTALYLAAGIALAFVLRDNRAFCKYLCPITVPLKLSARFALLRVVGDAARCEQDQACVNVCPMGIRITDYVQAQQRVLSTECILCQECISVCQHQALTLSVGWSRGGPELLREAAG